MATTTVRTFKSGNSEAVRLPKGFGFGPGTKVRIERDGGRVVLTAVDSEAERVRRFHDMLDRMEALGPVPGGREERDVDWWPERPGL
jgi:antitoxin VapB